MELDKLCEDIRRIQKPELRVRESWCNRYKINETITVLSISLSLIFLGYHWRERIKNYSESATASVVKYFDILEKEKQIVKSKAEEIERLGFVRDKEKKDYEDNLEKLTKEYTEKESSLEGDLSFEKRNTEFYKKQAEDYKTRVSQLDREALNSKKLLEMGEMLSDLEDKLFKTEKISEDCKYKSNKSQQSSKSEEIKDSSQNDYLVPEIKLDSKVIPSFCRFVEPSDIIDLHDGSVAVKIGQGSYRRVGPGELDQLNVTYKDYLQKFENALGKNRFMSRKVLEECVMKNLKTDLRKIVLECKTVSDDYALAMR